MVGNETDRELDAMSSVLASLSALEDRDTQARVLSWVAAKLGVGSRDISAKPVGREFMNSPAREGTVTTVAARLNVKSCRDLLVASAAHLSLYQGKEKFSRSDWVECAKDAKQWKIDYSVQIATTISRLLKAGFINETSKDVFSVQDDQLKTIGSRL